VIHSTPSGFLGQMSSPSLSHLREAGVADHPVAILDAVIHDDDDVIDAGSRSFNLLNGPRMFE
jgi:hypothetical protein